MAWIAELAAPFRLGYCFRLKYHSGNLWRLMHHTSIIGYLIVLPGTVCVHWQYCEYALRRGLSSNRLFSRQSFRVSAIKLIASAFDSTISRKDSRSRTNCRLRTPTSFLQRLEPQLSSLGEAPVPTSYDILKLWCSNQLTDTKGSVCFHAWCCLLW